MFGCVVVEVEIDGVFYEYLVIEGVQEDVIEILLNLKGLVIKLYGCDEVMLILVKKGLGVVIVVDIQLDYDVEIINGDYVIVNLVDNGVLNMKLKVVCGCGYEFVDVCQSDEDESCSIGCLQFDVLFSLVCCVFYVVENVCVEQCINLDKLVLDLEINGILDFEEVICCVVIIL